MRASAPLYQFDSDFTWGPDEWDLDAGAELK